MSILRFEDRDIELQRYQSWLILEILVRLGIMVACFIYIFVRYFTRNAYMFFSDTSMVTKIINEKLKERDQDGISLIR